LDVSWINQNIPDELSQIKENFVPVLDLINQSIVTVQKISSQLRPGILDDLGLANAIQWHSNETSRRSDLNFKLNLNDNDGNLSDIIKTQLYRVFQEALTNILRHAEAKNVEVNLKLRKNKLTFEIIDDGIGTTKENIDNINSLGIIGMKERVATINGEINFITIPNKGTKIKIVIPV
jgi:signal transduction histidine kinase